MSGLLALLDDVAVIARVAATSLDDVMAQAAKAGSKAAGAIIDDAAVTPKYVHGFEASRELPIIWTIAKGSFKNKLLYLLPAGILLSTFFPWTISPLLMMGGAYLCFEGAEKIWHFLAGHPQTDTADAGKVDPDHLEEQRIAGAIKTDFILSAEIMTITLAAIPPSNIWMEAATLGVVSIGITVVIYGSVAVIVKADDVGLYMSRNARFGVTRRLGRAIVKMMPGFLTLLSNVGTAAMLWVGGSIVVHGIKDLGFGWLAHHIHDLAAWISTLGPVAYMDAVAWTATAAMDGVFALALGFILVPLVTRVVLPAVAAVKGAVRG